MSFTSVGSIADGVGQNGPARRYKPQSYGPALEVEGRSRVEPPQEENRNNTPYHHASRCVAAQQANSCEGSSHACGLCNRQLPSSYWSRRAVDPISFNVHD